MMTVSVIIPIFNSAQYLDKCLKSVVNQTGVDMEILCIDDGSTDSSIEIINNWVRQDSRIYRYTNERNMGLSYCRNLGVEKANGEYILFLDSDDYIDNHILEKLVDRIKKDKLDMLGFGYIEEKDNIFKYINSACKHNMVFSGVEILEQSSTVASYHMTSWSYLYKKSFLLNNRIRFREGILHEDSLYYLQCMLVASRVLYVDDYLYHYRRNDMSITFNSKNYIRRLESICVIINEIIKFYTEEEDITIKNLLSKYINSLSHSAAGVYKLIDFFPDNYRASWDCVYYILPIIQGGFYNGYLPRKFTKKQMEMLKNGENILIYGAGDVGKGVEKLLIERNINNYKFVVSEKTATDYLSIDECKKYKENSVLIIASSRYRDDMLKKAKEIGFVDIIIPYL